MFGFGSKKVEVEVKGMSCGHCEKTVEEGLGQLSGVSGVKADHASDRVTIKYKGECPTVEDVKTKMADLGYEVANSWTC